MLSETGHARRERAQIVRPEPGGGPLADSGSAVGQFTASAVVVYVAPLVYHGWVGVQGDNLADKEAV